MALLRDKAQRDAIRSLKAQIREIERPEVEARKIKRAKSRAKREKGLVRSQGQRQPRVKDKAYLAWIRRLPCAACGATRRVEAAHVRAGYAADGWAPTGMMEKPSDHRAVPLCAHDHREGPDAQHRANERSWWQARGIHPPDLCRDLRAAFPDIEAAASVLTTHRKFNGTIVRKDRSEIAGKEKG